MLAISCAASAIASFLPLKIIPNYTPGTEITKCTLRFFTTPKAIIFLTCTIRAKKMLIEAFKSYLCYILW